MDRLQKMCSQTHRRGVFLGLPHIMAVVSFRVKNTHERSQPVFVLNYLIYFLLHWVFVTVRRVSLVVASEGFSAGRGFLTVVASLGVEHGLQAHRLCSCGPQA